ncbi:unnamed protein product [Spirodela intermedia]|uniref:Dof zinc finger protein n=1 Tax=Spirodela intermedia TaxID=51605 RepID=A0A7I8LEU6_SPIIN|nr:unnamed protein product [Spirodela intermedia]
MQDLRQIPSGGAGRIFGGGAGVFAGGAVAGGGAATVDRRLRPHPQQNLKCPRCESNNTKFCYYNNYNISQPRHFCKSCRRYWTKGGVLRNVPVGGGCRKSKRSSSSSSRSSPKPSSEGFRKPCPSPPAATSRSSSDSSGLATAAVLDRGSYAAVLLETMNGGAPPASATAAALFPATGSLTGLIAASGNPEALSLNFQLPRAATADGDIKVPPASVSGGLMDPPPPPPPPLPLPAMDWQGVMENTPPWLFDTVGAASVADDHGGFWNHNHWGEIDPSLFLP